MRDATDRLRRAWHPGVPGEGAVVSLSTEESHHVSRVLRLRPGDRLAVFDGRGREWEATLESAARASVDVRVGVEILDPVEPGLRVVVFQALSRPERIEWAIQKGTEVGASAFRLWSAERSQVEAPSGERLRRYERVALEACKQSGRRRIPEVEASPSALPPAPPPGLVALLLDGGEDSEPVAIRLAVPAPDEAWIVVGPEGGLSPDERRALASSGWLPTSLGPRVLRTETAGVVACALALHAWDAR